MNLSCAGTSKTRIQPQTTQNSVFSGLHITLQTGPFFAKQHTLENEVTSKKQQQLPSCGHSNTQKSPKFGVFKLLFCTPYLCFVVRKICEMLYFIFGSYLLLCVMRQNKYLSLILTCFLTVDIFDKMKTVVLLTPGRQWW